MMSTRASTLPCNGDNEVDGRTVLTVGLVCLDIINVLDHYPLEDTEQRACEQLWSRGGNAANTSVVLAQLGVHTAFMGTLANHALSQLLVEDFDRYGVQIDNCVYHKGCSPPTTCVIANSSVGTRTILSVKRSLPELTSRNFHQLDLNNYKWIHFEGRNIHEVQKMIDIVDTYNTQQGETARRIRVSLELEKPSLKLLIYELLLKVDVIFISKELAKECGCQSGEDCVMKFNNHIKPSAVIICAWGEIGALASSCNGSLVHSPAYPPPRVIDTLGAGDTFNAGVISSLSRGRSLSEAISRGCKLAGDKVGHRGFEISTSTI